MKKMNVTVTEPILLGVQSIDGFCLDVSHDMFKKNPDKVYEVPAGHHLVDQYLKTGILKKAEKSVSDKPKKKGTGGTNAKNS